MFAKLYEIAFISLVVLTVCFIGRDAFDLLPQEIQTQLFLSIADLFFAARNNVLFFLFLVAVCLILWYTALFVESVVLGVCVLLRALGEDVLESVATGRLPLPIPLSELLACIDSRWESETKIYSRLYWGVNEHFPWAFPSGAYLRMAVCVLIQRGEIEVAIEEGEVFLRVKEPQAVMPLCFEKATV